MVRADQGELTKLPGIATPCSLVPLGVVHDQQRAPYDVGSKSSGSTPTLIARSLQQLLLGIARGLACGRKRSQKVLWHGRKGARRCV